MKTKNYLLLFLVLTFSISSNTFVRAYQFENGRLKDIEDKINESNQNAEAKRNTLIVAAVFTCVTALGGWTYYVKRESNGVAKREDKVKQQESDYARLKDIENSKNLDIEGLKKEVADLIKKREASQAENDKLQKDLNILRAVDKRFAKELQPPAEVAPEAAEAEVAKD